jgi:FtsH-binding integral membrane protein
MNYGTNGPYGAAPVWQDAYAGGRERFIVRTYNTLLAAIAAFAGLEIVLFLTGAAQHIAAAMMGTSWLLVLGGFMVVSWLARHAARRAETTVAQLLGLGLYVVAEAIIFVPLLFIAEHYAPGAIRSAALVTLLGFGGLTGVAFWTRKDFSFLGGVLRWAGILSLVLIIAAVVFGFTLGTFFSVAMVGLAGAAILYDTSRVMRDYPENRFVSAALELFASVALMFWYVLRIFLGSRR